MKTLIILMASILVTSIQTFAQQDINEIEIKCSLAEAQDLVPELMERYQIPDSVDGRNNTYLLGDAIKADMAPMFNSSNKADEFEPDTTAELVKEAACVETFAYNQKNFPESSHAKIKARAAEVAADLTSRLDKMEKYTVGDKKDALIFAKANYKMFRANARTVAFIFMVFSDEAK